MQSIIWYDCCLDGDFKKIEQKSWLNKQKLFHKLIMNNKITGSNLHTDIAFGQFRFLKMLYRVIQTKLLQEPVLAQCAARGEPNLSKCWSLFCFWIYWLVSLADKSIQNFHDDLVTLLMCDEYYCSTFIGDWSAF